MSRQPIFYLEEVSNSVLKGIGKNVCSGGSRFNTFVLPNGDKVVFCASVLYKMNRYDVPYWRSEDEFLEKESPEKKRRTGSRGNTTDSTPETQRKKTRVFVYNYSGLFSEIEEYAKDQIWILNHASMELWNHQTEQLVQTIDVAKISPFSCDTFIHFMKNGNIAVFTEILNIYDPTRSQQPNALVLKRQFDASSHPKIKLAIETAENKLYVLIHTTENMFKHVLINLTDEEEGGFYVTHDRLCIETQSTRDEKESNILEERVTNHLTNERDKRMLETYRRFVVSKEHNYSIYEWNLGRTFYSWVIQRNSNMRVTDVSGFDRTNDIKTDMHVVSMNRHDSNQFLYSRPCYNNVRDDENELWLVSGDILDTKRLDKIKLGSRHFNLLVLDTDRIVCIFPDGDDFTERVFKICSR